MIDTLKKKHKNWAEILSLLNDLHIAEEKVRLFEIKYKSTFAEFERQIKNQQEDFEKWDDYMEWKAYERALVDLQDIKAEIGVRK